MEDTMRKPSSLALRMTLLPVLVLAVLAGPVPGGQQKDLFTVDDYFTATSLRIDDLTRDGRWAACQISTPADRLPQDYTRYGDPTYISASRADFVVLDTKTGDMTRIYPEKRQVRSASWSRDGGRLAYLVLEEGRYQLTVWGRESGRLTPVPIPVDNILATEFPLIWSPDGTKLFFAVRSAEWEAKTRELFETATKGPILVMDTDEPFLLWDNIRRRSRLAVPVFWDFTEKKLTGLLPEIPLVSIRLTEDGTAILFERDVTEKTNYDVIGGTRNRLEVLPFPSGKPRPLLPPYEQRRLAWSRDSKTFAYSDKGDVFVMGLEDKEPRNLTGEKKEEAGKAETPKDEKKEKKQSFDAVRFSPDGAFILCSSTRPAPDEDKDRAERRPSPPRQYWLVAVRTGERRMIYEFPENEDDRPNLQLVDWSPDGRSLYFGTSAPDKYDRGLVRFDILSKSFTDLRRSDHVFGRWEMSWDGSTFLFMESDGDAPDELHAADREFAAVKKLTRLNPQLSGKALSHTELVSYRDADGKKLHGVLYYPARYEKGKTYPLITEVYEEYFHNGFNPTLNIFTSAGYAVLHPSVNFNRGYPGEAWAKGALAAINKVIEMGVADPDRLGIQGTSYGGYATVLLITQTDRFKAAINNSGKVDMVSFYTQSPRLGVRNIHAPEKSQDRIGGTLWEYPERYLAHSAILDADRITTPLLCITGDLDPNVEALQSQEIFYALRRLGKKCVWLRYSDGPHGGPNSAEERRDMYRRMLEWYGTYLKSEKK
jgi:dipeptidyl aminopeptidase/acylaminoacyl peptidase